MPAKYWSANACRNAIDKFVAFTHNQSQNFSLSPGAGGGFEVSEILICSVAVQLKDRSPVRKSISVKMQSIILLVHFSAVPLCILCFSGFAEVFHSNQGSLSVIKDIEPRAYRSRYQASSVPSWKIGWYDALSIMASPSGKGRQSESSGVIKAR